MLTRDQYGYPMELRLLQAQFYAAEARERIKSARAYAEKQKLEAVQNILNNRSGGRDERSKTQFL
jgi:hypothetical protein